MATFGFWKGTPGWHTSGANASGSGRILPVGTMLRVLEGFSKNSLRIRIFFYLCKNRFRNFDFFEFLFYIVFIFLFLRFSNYSSTLSIMIFPNFRVPPNFRTGCNLPRRLQVSKFLQKSQDPGPGPAWRHKF